MFVCSNGHCIGRHFVCDGKPDCKFGVDEAYENCGPNPCEGTPCLILYQIKIVCSDMLLFVEVITHILIVQVKYRVKTVDVYR